MRAGLASAGLWTAMVLVTAAGCARKEPAAAPVAEAGAEKAPAAAAPAVAPAAAITPTDDDLRGEVRIGHTLTGGAAVALEAIVTNWNRNHPGLRLTPTALDPAGLAAAATATELLVVRHDDLDALRSARALRPLSAPPPPTALPELGAMLVQPTADQHGLALFGDTMALWFHRERVPTAPTGWEAGAAPKGSKPGALRWGPSDLDVIAALGHSKEGPALDVGFAALTRWKQADKAAAAVGPAELAAAMNQGGPTLVLGPLSLRQQLDKHGPWLPALIPAAPGAAAAKPWVDVWAVGVAANARQPEVAERIARLLASDEAALTWHDVGGQLPASAKFYENARWATQPVVRVFRAQLAKAVARPPKAVWQALLGTLQRAEQAAATPGLLPEQAWQHAAQTR